MYLLGKLKPSVNFEEPVAQAVLIVDFLLIDDIQNNNKNTNLLYYFLVLVSIRDQQFHVVFQKLQRNHLIVHSLMIQCNNNST